MDSSHMSSDAGSHTKAHDTTKNGEMSKTQYSMAHSVETSPQEWSLPRKLYTSSASFVFTFVL